MKRRPPISTRPATRFPDTTLFRSDAVVPVAGHRANGKVTVLVQHSEGFTTPGQSTRGDAVTAYSDKGVTPRADYDFTIGWGSDTQYYNETEARSAEHTSELQSLMRSSYAVFCLNKQKSTNTY